MQKSLKGSPMVPIICLALCLLLTSLSWPMMKLGAIFAEIDFDDSYYFEWITSAYIIAEVAVIPVAGKLVDHFGLKKMVLVGTLVFVIGSLLCCFATSAEILTYFRGVQGIGAGFIFASAMTCPGLLLPRKHRNIGHSLMTGAFAIGSFFGTAVGFWFADVLDWRYIFIVPLVLAAAGGTIAWRVLDDQKDYRRDFDVIGMLLMLLIMGLGMYYTQGVNKDFDMFGTTSYAYLAVIIVAVILLYLQERRTENSVFPKNMHSFQIRIVLAIFLAAVIGLGIIQFYVKVGMTSYGMGIYQACGMLAFILFGGAITSLSGCRMVYYTGARPWILLGCSLTAAAMLLTYFIVGDGEVQLYLCLFVLGLGLGCIVTELLLSLQGLTPREDMGATTSVTMGLRLIGIYSGLAIYSYHINDKIEKWADLNIPSFSWSEYHGLDSFGIYNQIVNDFGGIISGLLGDLAEVLQDAFKECCLYAIPFCIIGCLVAYKMRSLDKFADLPEEQETVSEEQSEVL